MSAKICFRVRLPQKVTIGAETESIKALAFSGCKSLAEVNMQSNVLAEIGKGAFQNTAITEFTVPDTVDTLGAGTASATGAKDGIFTGAVSLQPSQSE